ncbi:SNF2 family N-terminal domain-containing protein [Fimicolochytrium jonesii]|uniref:SNF2 family N-terminal domain-containing protein n=1 Tax=Fimicolochytrium jonesii TaxID=1396493 RepID=UPI0022FDCC8C|nr:SNF2 family N-terminal domain-containing protein [Fimicolochytrium jonesii]KAI8817172.1 SNF2 family N-terminal domain-containing protein [Fimicolochytrium jonesii]
MGDKFAIEKLISWRTGVDGTEEIMVKYKNMSYYHAEWLSRPAVEASPMGKMRVKRFLDKPVWDTQSQWTEDEPFNPSFKLIDRLLDEGEMGPGEIFYLVKWKAQTYDNSTWESATLVNQLDAEKIKQYNRRRILTQDKESSYTHPPKRPLPKDWRKMDDSPAYKNDMILRPYQLEGLNWLLFCWYNRQNSILADEMGLGKTVQSTVFLDYLYTKEKFCGPFLIVTPLSTIGNWEREIKTWTNLNVVVYHGRETARNLIVETEFYYRDQNNHIITGIFKFDVILTTYEMAMSGAAQLRPINWRCVVLDEAHRLKNKTSKVAEILKSYKMDHRVLLTGTPLQNSLEELWALLNFLQPERFVHEAEFQAQYGSLSSAADVEKLQALLKPLMLRRMKEDVEKSIPVKEETIVEVELTTVQKKYYRSILEKNFGWLKQGPSKRNVPNLINTMIELRKCCIHPFLLKGAEDQIMKEKPADTVEQHFQALIQASGKMVLIDKLLVKLRAGGHKVLIFSQMTRCLDIIQDYLRGRQWQFERIDGGVRGDLRQAAIDRFSAPDSETFVFLLCTRAGGVGINLTAADTCIIFDSDWNPQNDLQAQSRVHRIGQKRPVQIYRLITRNTYEREMFDRASMKLGLDRAILQRMDGDAAMEGFDASKPPSSLSKTEIEELLKKGAYGAMLDDEASQRFCDEDIDSILSRRTQVVKHDAPAAQSEKGSIFSKATFSAGNADNVDINDPDFWDKMAEKAKLDIVEPLSTEAELIIDLPRQRRQVQRFGAERHGLTNFRGSPVVEDDGDEWTANGGGAGARQHRAQAEVIKPWAQAEKTRLERAMMVQGFDSWDVMCGKALNRRFPEDVRGCARAMVLHGLGCAVIDAETLADVKGAVGPEIEEFVKDGKFVIPEVPYPNPSRRQLAEYRSFMLDAPQEYLDHLEKRAKNMLMRVGMMHCIRYRIKPQKDTPMPRVVGAPPASWWGPKQDLHMLIGIAKHGYGQYDKIRADPDLCFLAQTFGGAENNASAGQQNGGDSTTKIELDSQDEDESKTNDEDARDNAVKDEKDDTLEFDDMDDDDPDAGGRGSELPSGAGTPSLNATDSAAPPPLNGTANVFPSPSDLGFRLRRIIAAFTKQLNASARESAKQKQASEKTRLKLEREQEKIRAREQEYSRKDRQEFQRTLLSYGVDTVPGQPDVRDWTRFKELSSLKKSPEALEVYFGKLVRDCEEIVRKAEAIPDQDADVTANGDAANGDATASGNGKTSVNGSANGTGNAGSQPQPVAGDEENADTQEDVTYDRAKRILKRVDQMRILRLDVLTQPHLEQKIGLLKRHGRSGLPTWWTAKHDLDFLKGVAKWGLTRNDLIIEDPDLMFYELHQEFLASLKKRASENLGKDELVDGKWEDKFWMREPVALRRFDALIEAAMKPLPKPRGKPGRKPKDAASSPAPLQKGQVTPSETPTRGPGGKSVKLKLKLGQTPEGGDPGAGAAEAAGTGDGTASRRRKRDRDAADRESQVLPPAASKKKQKKKHRESPAVERHRDHDRDRKHRRRERRRSETGSSGDDTDTMLQAARRKTDRSRKKRKRDPNDSDILSDDDSDVDLRLRSRRQNGESSTAVGGLEQKDRKRKRSSVGKPDKGHHRESKRRKRSRYDGSSNDDGLLSSPISDLSSPSLSSSDSDSDRDLKRRRKHNHASSSSSRKQHRHSRPSSSNGRNSKRRSYSPSDSPSSLSDTDSDVSPPPHRRRSSHSHSHRERERERDRHTNRRRSHHYESDLTTSESEVDRQRSRKPSSSSKHARRSDVGGGSSRHGGGVQKRGRESRGRFVSPPPQPQPAQQPQSSSHGANGAGRLVEDEHIFSSGSLSEGSLA